MGVLLTVKNADFAANAIAFAAPVTEGLEFWNYYTDPTKVGRNLVPGKAAPSIVGTPGAGANFVTLSNNVNYLVTGLTDQAEVTMLTVARVNAGAAAGSFKYMIGNYSSGGTAPLGSNLYFVNNSANTLATLCSRNNGTSDIAVAATLTPANSGSTFAFYAARMGASYLRIDDKTRGLNASASTANPRSTPSGNPYRIGGAGTTTGTGGVTDMAFAGLYSRTLTDAEIEAVYQRVKTFLSGKGIGGI